MEPEDGFHRHVDGRGQIVAAAGVAQLVRQNRLQFRVLQAIPDAGRKPKDRAEDAEDAGFQFGGGGDQAGQSGKTTPFKPAHGFQFAALPQRRGRAHRGGDAAPARPAIENDRREAAGPNRQKQGRQQNDRVRRRWQGSRRRCTGDLNRRKGLHDFPHHKRQRRGRRRGQKPPSQAGADGGQQSERDEEFDRRRQPQPVPRPRAIDPEDQGQQRGGCRKAGGLPEMVGRQPPERHKFLRGHRFILSSPACGAPFARLPRRPG